MARTKQKKVIRGIIFKCCSRCGDYHPESEFNMRADTADHLQYYCKECNREYWREWSERVRGR